MNKLKALRALLRSAQTKLEKAKIRNKEHDVETYTADVKLLENELKKYEGVREVFFYRGYEIRAMYNGNYRVNKHTFTSLEKSKENIKDLEFLKRAKPKEIINHELFKAELLNAIKSGKDIDYVTDNGGDEYPIDYFNADYAFERVIEVLTEYIK